MDEIMTSTKESLEVCTVEFNGMNIMSWLLASSSSDTNKFKSSPEQPYEENSTKNNIHQKNVQSC